MAGSNLPTRSTKSRAALIAIPYKVTIINTWNKSIAVELTHSLLDTAMDIASVKEWMACV